MCQCSSIMLLSCWLSATFDATDYNPTSNCLHHFIIVIQLEILVNILLLTGLFMGMGHQSIVLIFTKRDICHVKGYIQFDSKSPKSLLLANTLVWGRLDYCTLVYTFDLHRQKLGPKHTLFKSDWVSCYCSANISVPWPGCWLTFIPDGWKSQCLRLFLCYY